MVTLATMMGVGFVLDHLWLVGQRNLLKSATDAASVAATLQLRSFPKTVDDATAEAALQADRAALHRAQCRPHALGRRAHGSSPSRSRWIVTLGTVDVRAEAPLGGTLFGAIHGYLGLSVEMQARSGADYDWVPVWAVLAIRRTSRTMNNALDGSYGVPARRSAHHHRQSRGQGVHFAAVGPDPDIPIAIGLVPWSRSASLGRPCAFHHRGDDRDGAGWSDRRWFTRRRRAGGSGTKPRAAGTGPPGRAPDHRPVDRWRGQPELCTVAHADPERPGRLPAVPQGRMRWSEDRRGRDLRHRRDGRTRRARWPTSFASARATRRMPSSITADAETMHATFGTIGGVGEGGTAELLKTLERSSSGPRSHRRRPPETRTAMASTAGRRDRKMCARLRTPRARSARALRHGSSLRVSGAGAAGRSVGRTVARHAKRSESANETRLHLSSEPCRPCGNRRRPQGSGHGARPAWFTAVGMACAKWQPQIEYSEIRCRNSRLM